MASLSDRVAALEDQVYPRLLGGPEAVKRMAMIRAHQELRNALGVGWGEFDSLGQRIESGTMTDQDQARLNSLPPEEIKVLGFTSGNDYVRWVFRLSQSV